MVPRDFDAIGVVAGDVGASRADEPEEDVVGAVVGEFEGVGGGGESGED